MLLIHGLAGMMVPIDPLIMLGHLDRLLDHLGNAYTKSTERGNDIARKNLYEDYVAISKSILKLRNKTRTFIQEHWADDIIKNV